MRSRTLFDALALFSCPLLRQTSTDDGCVGRPSDGYTVLHHVLVVMRKRTLSSSLKLHVPLQAPNEDRMNAS
jgi:hypothetical protein